MLLGLAVLLMVLFFVLKPADEPNYQSRPLSEWLAIYQSDVCGQQSSEFEEAREAVIHIGTNALPYLLKCIRYEPPAWKKRIRRQLPDPIADNETFNRWFDGPSDRRSECAMLGLGILGTNAVAVMPELVTMMRDSTTPARSVRAMLALGSFGESAIPAYRLALADTNQSKRYITSVRLTVDGNS